ncbi:MAG: hypothetical protein IPK53_03250 [bacterium]|nr:hypothetical protein [bacterium]
MDGRNVLLIPVITKMAYVNLRDTPRHHQRHQSTRQQHPGKIVIKENEAAPSRKSPQIFINGQQQENRRRSTRR